MQLDPEEPTHLRLEVSGLGQLVIVLYMLYVLIVCYCLYCVLHHVAFPKINKQALFIAKYNVYHFFPAKEALEWERVTSSQELLGGLDLRLL